MDWTITTDRHGRRHYVTPEGYVVDGTGYGRMRWTVLYPMAPGGWRQDYGMTDTLAEARAWAEADRVERFPR